MSKMTLTKGLVAALPFLLTIGTEGHAQDTQTQPPDLSAIFPKDKDEAVGGCKPRQRFFLRSRISGESLLFCDLDSSDGATLTYSRNSVSGETMLNSKAGFGMRLGDTLRLGQDTSAAFLAYAEISNETASTGEDEGQVRIGFDGNFISGIGNPRAARGTAGFAGAGVLVYSFGAYYLTDVNFDARGYGLRATAHPEIPALRINTKRPQQNFYWSFGADLEALKVEKAGSTGLLDDAEYAWAGYTLEAIYEAKPKIFPYGFEASIGSDYAKDLTSGEEMHKLFAKATVYLDPAERVALTLSHARGETRTEPDYAKTTTLNIEFKF